MNEQIHHYLSEIIKANEAGASVAVVRNDEIIHREAYGLANLEWQIPNSPETIFRLGSITKQFTALAIMMLLEQGKVSLDDPITKFFPDFSTSGHHVTVTHLLNHTSGIRSNTSLPDFEKLMRRKLSAQEIYELFAHLPFDFAPGDKWLYNNSAYHLLGMIIEKVSGQSYEDFLRANIFEPLEMHSASYLQNEPIIPKRASGYEMQGETIVNSAFIDMSVPFAAGALGASVDDLIKWDKALRENRLIKAETLALMHQPTLLNDGSTHPYGFGWAISNYHDYSLVHHGGGIPGFLSYMIHLFADNMLVIVLCNTTTLNSEMLALACLRRALNIPEPDYSDMTLTAEQFACVEGEFTMQGADGSLAFNVIDSELIIPRLSSFSPFRPFSENKFYSLRNSDVTLVFEDDFSTAVLKMAFESFSFKRAEIQSD